MLRDTEKSEIMDAHISENLVWQRGKVAPADRARLPGREPATIWLTGLSGAGKSTIAFELERQLVAGGRPAYVLDGDNIRHGLNRDLGFSPQDRKENIRRIAEVAKLFNDAGVLVITAFISPYRQDRSMARLIIGKERFIETHLCTSIEVCAERDPKGLYEKARQGKIAEFTGVSAPYEMPDNPEVVVDTARSSIEDSVLEIMLILESRLSERNGDGKAR
jgi:adenylyl-sulfate kinase